MGQNGFTRAMGWLRDLPDFRDFTIDQDEAPARAQRTGTDASIRTMLTRIGTLDGPIGAPSPLVDLRPWMSPVEDQGEIGSCTAQAGIGLVEYYERRAFGRHVNRSRLFLYKAVQGHTQPAALDRRYGCLPADDDGRARALRRAAGGVLALRDRRLRQGAQRVLLCLRAELPEPR